MPFIEIVQTELSELFQSCSASLFRSGQAGEFRLPKIQTLGGHEGAIECIDEIRVPIQSAPDRIERHQLLRIGVIERLQFPPVARCRWRIIEVVHDFDDVGLVCAVKLKVILRLKQSGGTFEVVIEGVRRPVDILPAERPVHSFLMR